MRDVIIYAVWYSFYGQFDFLNDLFMWLLELSNNGNTYGNPFQAMMSFNNDAFVLPKWYFLLTGLAWDGVIFLLFKKYARHSAKPEMFDSL